MRQGLTRCQKCGRMRAAAYVNALEQWLCIDCVGAVLDQVLTAKNIEELKEQRTGDQAQSLRDAVRARGIWER